LVKIGPGSETIWKLIFGPIIDPEEEKTTVKVNFGIADFFQVEYDYIYFDPTKVIKGGNFTIEIVVSDESGYKTTYKVKMILSEDV
jgi:hypothetical protein